MVDPRSMTSDDVERLVPLKASVHALHVDARPDVFKAMTAEAVAQWLGQRLAEGARGWLVEEAGEPIGYLLAVERQSPETAFAVERHWLEVDEVVVDPRRRRGGIARALIERAADHARRQGLETVQLTTWAFNDGARETFERAGFRPMVLRYERASSIVDPPMGGSR